MTPGHLGDIIIPLEAILATGGVTLVMALAFGGVRWWRKNYQERRRMQAELRRMRLMEADYAALKKEDSLPALKLTLEAVGELIADRLPKPENRVSMPLMLEAPKPVAQKPPVGPMRLADTAKAISKGVRSGEAELRLWASEALVSRQGHELQAKPLYEVYVVWAEARKIEPVTISIFGRLMPEIGYSKTRNSKSLIVYQNVAIRQGNELPRLTLVG